MVHQQKSLQWNCSVDTSNLHFHLGEEAITLDSVDMLSTTFGKVVEYTKITLLLKVSQQQRLVI